MSLLCYASIKFNMQHFQNRLGFFVSTANPSITYNVMMEDKKKEACTVSCLHNLILALHSHLCVNISQGISGRFFKHKPPAQLN